MDFDHEVLFRVQCSFSWQKWDYVLAIPSNKDWEWSTRKEDYGDLSNKGIEAAHISPTKMSTVTNTIWGTRTNQKCIQMYLAARINQKKGRHMHSLGSICRRSRSSLVLPSTVWSLFAQPSHYQKWSRLRLLPPALPFGHSLLPCWWNKIPSSRTLTIFKRSSHFLHIEK